jgi:hypothetical protein
MCHEHLRPHEWRDRSAPACLETRIACGTAREARVCDYFRLATIRELSRHLLPNLSETHLFWGLFMLALFVDFYCAFFLAAT